MLRLLAVAVSLLSVALGSCDSSQRSARPASFCENWQTMSPAGRAAYLDSAIGGWLRRGEASRSRGARFGACLGSAVFARSHEISSACAGFGGDLHATAVLTQTIASAATGCADTAAASR